MSLTTTIEANSLNHLSVLSSPSKCRRNTDSRPSNQDFWKWTLTADAIASCFVRDVFDMSENTGKGVFHFLSTNKRRIFFLNLFLRNRGFLLVEARTV